ncbi:TetR/AcrR family transcriptional regulator [Streptomyces sp. NBC_01264]|uniref:TetR/AcrR family transcriptional regulator n=1 Tax=Streptomyces sp. NBC_01264 TaxID=2903804 RepID=UPI002252290A|nr:TetR/AcrR family transcriptional regulator [Streptomyces sp. NBC_01264]MCX4778495.1 TetR/AcrR family transcriptional regulator [Streptomyces sp. NBC_01264]
MRKTPQATSADKAGESTAETAPETVLETTLETALETAPQPATGPEAEAAPRRRQARGERRIAQLLTAAAGVFCRTGYAAASTNAIAREAGVSPGTLYQFFPNKEAIAVELGGQLLQRAHEAHGLAFLPENLDRPLPELLDAVLDPVIAFNCENPAFVALMHGSGIPGIAQEHDELHVGMLTRVEGVLRACVAPAADGAPATDAEFTHVATMVLAIVQTSLELILASEGAERAAYVAELKTVLFRYLDPMITTPPPR